MKVNLNGKEVEVEQVKFVAVSEPFGVVQLEDGTEIRVKAITTRVARVLGEKDSEGHDVYFVNTQAIVMTDYK